MKVKRLTTTHFLEQTRSWIIVFESKLGNKYRDTKMWRTSLETCKSPMRTKEEAQELFESLKYNNDKYYIATIAQVYIEANKKDKWR